VTLIDDLTTQATTRDLERGWKRESVESLPELRDPELLKPFARAYMTDKSLTIRDTKTRKVMGSRVANGEVARLYLKSIMAQDTDRLSKRVPYRRDSLQFLDRHPAYYFAGQCAGPFVLVDISACYATLYSRLTLDLTYRPDTDPPLLGLGRGYFPSQSEWLQAKGPRNAMWGCLLRPRLREWRHGEPIDNAFPNVYFAPDLVGAVLDACHSIAQQAVKMGALSWAVDGGAFRPDEGERFIEWLSTSYGLTSGTRAEGPGWLFGATSYSIGPVTTLDVKKGKAQVWPETNNLRRMTKRQSSWLADVMKERAC